MRVGLFPGVELFGLMQPPGWTIDVNDDGMMDHPVYCGCGNDRIAKIDKAWPGEAPIRLMFMDEARFGRISDTRYCWCPKPFRPVCYSMVSQKYTYAYGAWPWIINALMN